MCIEYQIDHVVGCSSNLLMSVCNQNKMILKFAQVDRNSGNP